MATSPVTRVFEPALCCATGVCGPELDEKLVRFTADIDYLKGKGVDIERHNLAVDPMAFASDETVRTFLRVAGSEGLPLTLVDGVDGSDPDEDLCCTPEDAAATGCCSEVALPVVEVTGGCCSAETPATAATGGGCCSGSTAPAAPPSPVHADLGLTPAGRSGCC